jgi:hypothetical protein
VVVRRGGETVELAVAHVPAWLQERVSVERSGLS